VYFIFHRVYFVIGFATISSTDGSKSSQLPTETAYSKLPQRVVSKSIILDGQERAMEDGHLAVRRGLEEHRTLYLWRWYCIDDCFLKRILGRNS
jgi:hypothetical protein